MNKQHSSRRQFIKTGLGALAGFHIVPRHVLGGTGYLAPSDQLTRAVIGVGNQGTGQCSYPGAKLLAVCDVNRDHVKRAVKRFGPDVKGYHDFREVLERKDIDIVHIPTPPHWHALIAIAAAKAGKDIWCEKPMARTIAEGQKIVEAVQTYNRIFRLNTWFRFDGTYYGFGTTVHPIKKLVDSGLLGWPLKVNVSEGTGFAWKLYWCGKIDVKPEAVPAHLDYDFWLGPASYKPYTKHRAAPSFRGYWDYDGGGLGDMGQHYLDPVQYLLGKDNTSPVFIEADAPPQHPDAVGSWRKIWMKYADGCEITLDAQNKDLNVPFLEGPHGKLYRGFRSDIPNLKEKLAHFPEPEPQVTNFYDAVRSRTKFALNESNGHRSCTIVNMAKIATRMQRPLHFDPETMRFINDDQANLYVDEPMRGPWHL